MAPTQYRYQTPILYIKDGCPFCIEAMNWLDSHGVPTEVIDVNKDHGALRRMISVSGQTRTPTLEIGEFVCADFSIAELIEELEQNPEAKRLLGLGDDEDT